LDTSDLLQNMRLVRTSQNGITSLSVEEEEFALAFTLLNKACLSLQRDFCGVSIWNAPKMIPARSFQSISVLKAWFPEASLHRNHFHAVRLFISADISYSSP
jgi:hypothetical protein